jgi:hypothetical protein
MSVNSMTNSALTWRTDYEDAAPIPRSAAENANATSRASTAQNPVTSALAIITTYIPTEILTLYVATLAAIQTPNDSAAMEQRITFWIFLVLSPVIIWLVYAAKLRSDNKPLPLSLRQWPIWEMVAATLSYVAWAISLPGSSILQEVGLPPGLGAVLVIATAALLGLIAPIFQRPLPA